MAQAYDDILLSDLLFIYMDHLHGLCKNCLVKCTQSIDTSKKEKQCMRCSENQPAVIVEEEGVLQVLCLKCYMKQQSSPRRRSSLKPSPMKESGLFHLVSKNDMLLKSFFTHQGKMIKKIQKYFGKFEGRGEDAIKDLIKKSLVPQPTWDRIIAVCNKSSSLMYVFFSKSHLFGIYHSEPIKIGEKSVIDDSESGFFFSSRAKIELQFYKANSDSVSYNVSSKSISLGRPACVEIFFDGNEQKIRCDLISEGTFWLNLFVYRF